MGTGTSGKDEQGGALVARGSFIFNRLQVEPPRLLERIAGLDRPPAHAALKPVHALG